MANVLQFRRRAAARDPLLHDAPLRRWTVLAQDPSIRGPGGAALTTQVTVAAERLEPGPKGHRVHVIDLDASTDTYYKPRLQGLDEDPFEGVTDLEQLIRDPHFHQQNVYAITMATLREFEMALGRPISWGFRDPGHQLKVAPHAFAEANAYYSRASESLSFGYFRARRNQTIFTCLSHDVIAHETSHAVLDGLRSFFMRPSSPDQGAFHEGFSDIVALLSVFKNSELIAHSLADVTDRRNLIRLADLDVDSLRKNVLAGLADEMGEELSAVRGSALRNSARLKPSPKYLDDPAYQLPHTRGEILVAAVLNTFLDVWLRRLQPIGLDRHLPLNRSVVAEEGATAAGQLLRIAIRALEYLPPVDLSFPDYLSALLTADMQLYPDDRYEYRKRLKKWFAAYGIAPASRARPDGAWQPPPVESLSADGIYFEQLQRDPEAVFRFIWENQEALGIDRDAFTRVTSVRPVTRVSTDQFVLRETVVEYVQTLAVFANELKALDIRKPDGLSGRTLVRLYGGGTLIFDQFGRLKFHIGTGVRSNRQTERLQSLWDRGYFARGDAVGTDLAQLHRQRVLHRVRAPSEQW